MKFEKTEEDLTVELSTEEELKLINKIVNKFDKLDNKRLEQLNDIKLIRENIYLNSTSNIKGWNSKIELPDIYELAQTLKSHISENLYSHPDAMFDVSGSTPQAQAFANRQKAMLTNVFEQMKLENELEHVIDGLVETGESTLFVGWETKIKQTRRAQSIEEQLVAPTEDGFIVEKKVVYDNPKVKYIKSEDFVFEKDNYDNFDNCPKIYRTYIDLQDLKNNKANAYLTPEKITSLNDILSDKNKKQDDKATNNKKLEILEYWGDIELSNGQILKNWLITVAGRKEIIRFEANPFIINPFIYANLIENTSTGRGISPLRVALVLNNIASTILNKQIDALALMMNPPYLAPKGCFKGEQVVKPGKIIEYDAALMPQAPIALNFDKAMQGWDFLTYFKSTIESATGIFNNMAGKLQTEARTATELNYSVSGQAARLNMYIDAINRKIIIPMVEKTAELIANFKIGKEIISVKDRGKILFIEVDENIRNANYIYRYGDRKATLERKTRLNELFAVVKSFADVPAITSQINWLECFKFALEQYGIENANNFLIGNDLN
ncbi:MAG: hypothetical protein MJ229_05765 [bacterium]|nr:hypothetical protein [bacterium]